MINRFIINGCFVFLGLCVLVILYHHFGPDDVLSIQPPNYKKVWVGGDDRESGNSKAFLKTMDNYWEVDYEIKEGAKYPFISFHIELDSLGLDLNSYDRVVIKSFAEGDVGTKLRLQLRNYDDRYFNGDERSLKYNEAQFDAMLQQLTTAVSDSSQIFQDLIN